LFVDTISSADIQSYLQRWAPPTQYIEVRVLPR
jgi:hypothetical protein